MLFRFVLNNLKSKLLRSILVTVSVTVGVMLVLMVYSTGRQIDDSFEKGTAKYDVVVGARGGDTQLVLNALFFHADPLPETIPTGVYEQIKRDFGPNAYAGYEEKVAKDVKEDNTVEYKTELSEKDIADGKILKTDYDELLKYEDLILRIAPLAMGDTLNGHKIVGTDAGYFEGLSLQKGRFFGEYEEGEPEMVLGYNTARRQGLGIGDQVAGSHEEEEIHDGEEEPHDAHDDFEYTVVGILDRTNTPDDDVAFTHYKSVWEVHEEGHGHDEDAHHDEDEDHDHDEEHDPGLVAIIIKAKNGVGGASVMLGAVTDDTIHTLTEGTDTPTESYGQWDFRIISANMTIRSVLQLFGSAQNAIIAILIVVIIMVFLMLFLAMLTAASERQKEIAILRALGSNKTRIFFTIILEALVIACVGAIAGLALSRIGLVVIRGFITGLFGIRVTGLSFFLPELLIMLGTAVFSVIATLLPASMVYRSEPSKYLH